MAEARGAIRILTDHFFRRFFDSDVVQVQGETLTTVVRAIAMTAAPGLITAFFLQNAYPRRSAWGAIQDHYFFVLYAFVTMGAAAVFEWEMLFPDRADFLILTPLPLRPRQMLTAKVTALAQFLALFLVSGNLFGTLILPAVSKGAFWRQIFAHGCAVLLAGAFAALLFLALGGVLLCGLGAARFRAVSPAVQMLAVAAMALLMLGYMRYSDGMAAWLHPPLGLARWMPPLWFLAVYEYLLHGRAAPEFARELAPYALYGTLAAGMVAVAAYPLAWARMRRLAMEGGARRRGRPAAWRRGLERVLHGAIRRPGERAAFHFIGQTMARNHRYQVYLAMYGGTGLALATSCAVVLRAAGAGVRPALAREGAYAALPLLLFWTIAGLRAAFAFPIDLKAGWVFRMTGASVGECAAAGRRWALVCAWAVMAGTLPALALAGWGARALMVETACGLCLSTLLTDAFFALDRSVPFNRPRMPGTKSLPLMLTLYIGVLPPTLIGVMRLEMYYERHAASLLPLALGVAALHAGLQRLKRGPDEVEEEMEGYEGEFQVLNLSRASG